MCHSILVGMKHLPLAGMEWHIPFQLEWNETFHFLVFTLTHDVSSVFTVKKMTFAKRGRDEVTKETLNRSLSQEDDNSETSYNLVSKLHSWKAKTLIFLGNILYCSDLA